MVFFPWHCLEDKKSQQQYFWLHLHVPILRSPEINSCLPVSDIYNYPTEPFFTQQLPAFLPTINGHTIDSCSATSLLSWQRVSNSTYAIEFSLHFIGIELLVQILELATLYYRLADYLSLIRGWKHGARFLTLGLAFGTNVMYTINR